MFKTAVTCTRAFLLVGSGLHKASIHSHVINTFTKTVVNTGAQKNLTIALPHVAKKSSHKLQPIRCSWKFKGHAPQGKIGVGIGFSLGLLGFFNKEEELSTEDRILMEMKRAILAIQVGFF